MQAAQMLTPSISTTAKGNQLEEAFVKWMEDCGYNSIVHVQGRSLSYIGGEYKPDILASRTNYFWTLGTIIAISYVIVWMCLACSNSHYAVNNPLFFVTSFFLAASLFVIGATRCRVHCWVECKNWEKPIDRSVIQNLYVSMIVAKDKRRGLWEGILVSRADFRIEILALASHLRIQCYQWTEKEFKKVSYTEPEPDPIKRYV